MQLTSNELFNQSFPIRKTALAASIASLLTGLITATPAYAINVNDNLKVEAKVFSDFTSISGSSSSAIDDAASGFHFSRAYFEVRGKTSKDDMVRITLDQKAADKSVFVKYAYWQHKYSDALTIKAGQNHTPLVDHLEGKMWGRRYISPIFVDKFHAETSSDLGVSILGKATKSIDYYVSIMNGEGYTHKTDGTGYAIMGRVEWHDAGAHVGIFNHTENDHSGIAGYDPTRVDVFGWWENQTFKIGGQYLTADDGSSKTRFDNGKGYNLLADLKLGKTTVFARYDTMDERNNGNNHTLAIAGVEFKAAKGVKVAFDYQTEDKGTPGSTSVDTIGAHTEFKF